MAKLSLPESVIESQILGYLKMKGIFAWKVKTVGTYDPKIGRFRKRNPLYRVGVSDIIGIFQGRPLAIEVKSAKGSLSPEQRRFLDEFRDNGGLTLVARSLESVMEFIELCQNFPQSVQPAKRSA